MKKSYQATKTSKYFSHEKNEEIPKRVESAKPEYRSSMKPIPTTTTSSTVSSKDNRMTILTHSKMKNPLIEKELAKYFKIVGNNNDTIIADIIFPKMALGFYIVDCKSIENAFEMDRKLDQMIEFSNQFKSAYTLLLVDSSTKTKASEIQCKSIGKVAIRTKQHPNEKCKSPSFFIFHSENQLLEFILQSSGVLEDNPIQKELYQRYQEHMPKKMEMLHNIQNVGNIVPIALRRAIPSLEAYQAQVLLDSLQSLENIFRAPSAAFIHEHTPLDLPTSQNIKSVLDRL